MLAGHERVSDAGIVHGGVYATREACRIVVSEGRFRVDSSGSVADRCS